MDNGQFERLFAEIAGSRREIAQVRLETQEAFAQARRETQEAFAQARLETQEAFAEARRHTDETVAELRQEIREGLAESRRHTDEVLGESRRYTDETAKSLRDEIRQSAEETRREFHVVEEGWRDQLRLLAEGIAMVDGKVDRLGVELRTELKTESAETRALIRLAYTDLDRRVTRLEGGLR